MAPRRSLFWRLLTSAAISGVCIQMPAVAQPRSTTGPVPVAAPAERPAAIDVAGVPANAVLVPPAARPPRASYDVPVGPPAYDPQVPEENPAGTPGVQLPQQITNFTDALQRAYWLHPNILAQRARLRGSDFLLPEARALSGPRLTYEARYGYTRDNFEVEPAIYDSRSGFTSTATAILSQPLFTFGRNAAAERQAKSQIAFQRSSMRSTENQTLFNAIRAYAALLRDRANVLIYVQDLTLLQREFSENSARFDKREVTSSDVQQVESRVEQAKAQLFLIQRASASSEASFLSAIGAPASADLAPPTPLPIPVQSLEEAYAFAVAHNPILGAAYARERISRAQRDAARVELLPRIDLRGQAQYGSISSYNDDLRRTNLRGEVVVTGPLFESGALRARLHAAEEANDADWRLIDQSLRENRAEVADAWNEWAAQSASIEQLRLSSLAARAAFDGALLQEKAGFRTTLDVLSLARELLIARSSYNSATSSAYVAQARLLAALGTLEQSYLFPDAPVYDPDEHLDRVKDRGMIPVIVPILRALDGIAGGGRHERPARDPSAPLGSPPVAIPTPLPQTSTKALANPVP